MIRLGYDPFCRHSSHSSRLFSQPELVVIDDFSAAISPEFVVIDDFSAAFSPEFVVIDDFSAASEGAEQLLLNLLHLP